MRRGRDDQKRRTIARVQRILALSDAGKKTVEIAIAIGLSESYTSNLLRAYRKAAPETWEAYENGDITADTLIALVRLPPEEQVALPKSAWRRKYRPRVQREVSMAYLRVVRLPGERNRHLAQALAWVLGMRERLEES